MLPKPGEGPTAEQRERGSYDLLFLGTAKDGRAYKARVTGDRDPGYGSTAKMIAEAAICLGETEHTQVTGGLWTPASAMGQRLIPRLIKNAGLTVRCELKHPTRSREEMFHTMQRWHDAAPIRTKFGS